MARFLLTGTLSSLRVRWAGWSPSWFVPLRATELNRSKLISLSGLGYSIAVHSAAGLRESASLPASKLREGGICTLKKKHLQGITLRLGDGPNC